MSEPRIRPLAPAEAPPAVKPLFDDFLEKRGKYQTSFAPWPTFRMWRTPTLA
jgi:hypothetical protein